MASTGEKRKANVSLQDLVAETLECPVCLQTIKDPPVFLCANGHELCHKCREPLKAEKKPCPVCQGELLDVRSRFAEKALDRLPKTDCKHEGCSFARSDTALVKSHEEKDCRMKPVKCAACPQHIPLSQINDHMITIHKMNPCHANLGTEYSSEGRENRLSTGLDKGHEYRITLVHINNSNLKFFFNRKYFNKSLLMFWISICGTQLEAEDYKYTIKIRNSVEKRAKEMYIFTGERECVSCDVSGEDMKERGDALFLNKALLERVANKNDAQSPQFSFTLTVKIVKK